MGENLSVNEEKILDYKKDWQYIKDTELAFIESEEQRESVLRSLMITALYN